MKKTFILIGQEQRERCIAFIQNLPFGKTSVEIGPYRKPRGLGLNAFHWVAVIEPIAEFVGETPERMHEILCGDYFGWVEKEFRGQRIPRPRRTTTINENGERDVLTTSEMQNFVHHCQSVAAELNVRLDMREAG